MEASVPAGAITVGTFKTLTVTETATMAITAKTTLTPIPAPKLWGNKRGVDVKVAVCEVDEAF